MKKKTNKHKAELKTAAALADSLGVSKATISRWMSEGDWRFGNPPWPRAMLEEIRTWSARESKGRAADAAKLRGLRAGKIAAETRSALARAVQAERENLIAARELIPAGEMTRAMEIYATTIRVMFQKLVARYPQDEPELQNTITEGQRQYETDVARILKGGA